MTLHFFSIKFLYHLSISSFYIYDYVKWGWTIEKEAQGSQGRCRCNKSGTLNGKKSVTLNRSRKYLSTLHPFNGCNGSWVPIYTSYPHLTNISLFLSLSPTLVPQSLRCVTVLAYYGVRLGRMYKVQIENDRGGKKGKRNKNERC